MRVVLVADRDPYVSYARPESSMEDSGLSIAVRGTEAWAAHEGARGTGQQADLLVLPAGLVLDRAFEKPELPFFAYGSDSSMMASFRAGARDCLREPWGIAELEARAGRLAILRFMVQGRVLALSGRRLESGSSSIHLGDNEARLLALLLIAPGEAVPRELLCRALGKPLAPGSRALDVLVSGLRKRLAGMGIFAGTFILACRGRGYRVLAETCG